MRAGWRCLFAAGVLALTTAAGPPPPAPIEERAVLSGKTRLDPSRGYIYLHATTRYFATFLRVPDEAQKAEYEKEFEEAFAKEQNRYPGRLKAWETKAKDLRALGQGAPPKPIEPKRETFAIAPIEFGNMVSIGPMFVYTKQDNYFGYLTSVQPGTYILYGNMVAAESGGFVGTCFCMGSVKFEVKPGMVTDLGNFVTAAPERGRTHDVATMETWRMVEAKAAQSGKPVESPFPVQPTVFGLPESLAAWSSARGQFSASGKMNNFYGVMVSRLPAIPGILSYRRDAVVDARTNSDVPNPPLLSRDKMAR